jgi:hypothetical protein
MENSMIFNAKRIISIGEKVFAGTASLAKAAENDTGIHNNPVTKRKIIILLLMDFIFMRTLLYSVKSSN